MFKPKKVGIKLVSDDEGRAYLALGDQVFFLEKVEEPIATEPVLDLIAYQSAS